MKLFDKKLVKKLVDARRYLHKFPELSGEEANTAAFIEKYLNKLKIPEVITGIGGFGIAARFKGEKKGKRVMFRCEMDALPIHEANEFLHKSKITNISHKCGHDGHIAIMLGLAELLTKHKIEDGEVVLIFQPAEETGEGALKIIQDPKFRDLVPDMAFALHNIPGYPLNSIIVREGCFAAGSAGMESLFFGKTSHAGEPGKGKNPALAVSQIIREMYSLNRDFDPDTFVTVVNVDIGEKSYGTSPGKAELRCTMRSSENSSLMKIAAEAENIVTNISIDHNLTNKIKIVQEFPPLMNDPEILETVVDSANAAGLEVIEMESPLPWSEDFSRFIQNVPGCLFGLGSGKDHAKLHQPDYDFPNRLIEGGVKIFFNIVIRTNGILK